MLSASAFDLRQRFLEQLCKRFGGGTFNLAGNIATNTLADYYSSLREDTLSNPDVINGFSSTQTTSDFSQELIGFYCLM